MSKLYPENNESQSVQYKYENDKDTSNHHNAEEEGRCGYGNCEPGFLRCCNNAKAFLIVYFFFAVVQGTLNTVRSRP